MSHTIQIIFLTILSITYSIAFEKVTGSQIAIDANKVVGKPYIWGGNDLSRGVDCSAFVKLLYSQYGYVLPRTANQQLKETSSCPTIDNLDETQLGDTLYFQNKEGKIHHVAIVTGRTNKKEITITHAKGKKFGVIEEKLSHKYKQEFIGAKRFYNCTSPLAQYITEEEVAETILYMAKVYKIDTQLIYTLIEIESNFEPLVITIETTPQIAEFLKSLRKIGLKLITGGNTFHSHKTIVNIYPKDIDMAQFIAESLKENGYAFDLGLMQIHSTNFSLEETASLVYPKNNLEKGLTILNDCKKIFFTLKNQIECYNRGTGNLRKALRKGIHSYPYYKRYMLHLNHSFKE